MLVWFGGGAGGGATQLTNTHTHDIPSDGMVEITQTKRVPGTGVGRANEEAAERLHNPQ